MFEEDVSANLRTCIAVAPRYCKDCGDFHLWWALRRVGKFDEASEWDGFREGIARGIAAAAAAGRRPSVLIAGAADSGILKTVVDAAFLAGGADMVHRVEVTVVDHCETPLQMCRDFAGQYGVSLTTNRADIGTYAPGRSFDVIAMHEVLPFFPPDHRVDYLRRISGWLNPEGILVTWSIASPQQSPADREDRRAAAFRTLETFLATAGSDIDADRDDLHERIMRGSSVKKQFPRPFNDPAGVLAFHESAGLQILEQSTMDRDNPPGGRHRNCVVVVARPAG